jgi:hypothetical protein
VANDNPIRNSSKTFFFPLAPAFHVKSRQFRQAVAGPRTCVSGGWSTARISRSAAPRHIKESWGSSPKGHIVSKGDPVSNARGRDDPSSRPHIRHKQPRLGLPITPLHSAHTGWAVKQRNFYGYSPPLVPLHAATQNFSNNSSAGWSVLQKDEGSDGGNSAESSEPIPESGPPPHSLKVPFPPSSQSRLQPGESGNCSLLLQEREGERKCPRAQSSAEGRQGRTGNALTCAFDWACHPVWKAEE